MYWYTQKNSGCDTDRCLVDKFLSLDKISERERLELETCNVTSLEKPPMLKKKGWYCSIKIKNFYCLISTKILKNI